MSPPQMSALDANAIIAFHWVGIIGAAIAIAIACRIVWWYYFIYKPSQKENKK